MTNLLIDCSSSRIEFGYSKDSKILFSHILENEFNADALTYFIKRAFVSEEVDIRDLDCVTLSNGPGSFTGLRIGSAIAKGICYGTGCRLIEIPTLDMIANKFDRKGIITSLIFSNSRTLEFYYCNYRRDSDKLEKISEYQTGLLEKIMKPDSFFVINEKTEGIIPVSLMKSITDVSGYPNIGSLNTLAKEYIDGGRFSDYKTSEPFYMKEFIPKN